MNEVNQQSCGAGEKVKNTDLHMEVEPMGIVKGTREVGEVLLQSPTLSNVPAVRKGLPLQEDTSITVQNRFQ
jgi:hypothetical protein